MWKIDGNGVQERLREAGFSVLEFHMKIGVAQELPTREAYCIRKGRYRVDYRTRRTGERFKDTSTWARVTG